MLAYHRKGHCGIIFSFKSTFIDSVETIKYLCALIRLNQNANKKKRTSILLILQIIFKLILNCLEIWLNTCLGKIMKIYQTPWEVLQVEITLIWRRFSLSYHASGRTAFLCFWVLAVNLFWVIPHLKVILSQTQRRKCYRTKLTLDEIS